MSLRHTVTVWCDQCANKYVIGETVSGIHGAGGRWFSTANAFTKAERLGWDIQTDTHLCPECSATRQGKAQTHTEESDDRRNGSTTGD